MTIGLAKPRFSLYNSASDNFFPTTLARPNELALDFPKMAPSNALDEAQQVCIRNGGRVVQSKKVQGRILLLAECEKHHIWWTRPDSILAGHWCRRCFFDAKRTPISAFQKLAKSRGGKCRSTSYLKREQKLIWECSKGHTWAASPGNIRKGGWCPKCAGLGRTIKDMQLIADRHGGKCLSRKYEGVLTKLQWQCVQGHRWASTPQSILQGSWCRICSDSVRVKHSLDDMRSLARSKGGVCMSSKYVDTRHALTWKCSQGHTWPANPSDILGGRWCPDCSTGKTERLCRAYFEKLFKVPFPIAHPTWLRNSRGNRMELDGFSERLGLAFEYHGRQHYENHPLFHGARSTLRQRMADDKLKENLCKAHGITLFIIPYTVADVDLATYIQQQCTAKNISHPKLSGPLKISLKRVSSPLWLAASKQMAQMRGGKCLSTHYISAQTKMTWQCKLGHQWAATPNHIKNGTWCPRCSGQVPLSIDVLRAFAKRKSGRCISTSCRNSNKQEWQCQHGHRWKALWGNIKKGTWCPTCHNERRRKAS